MMPKHQNRNRPVRFAMTIPRAAKNIAFEYRKHTLHTLLDGANSDRPNRHHTPRKTRINHLRHGMTRMII